MSQPQPLQQRILDCLRAHGPIGTGELPKWFEGVDRIDLDTTVTRLMRQNSVSLSLGKYDLVVQKPDGAHKPFVSQIAAPPSAIEEAETSLTEPTAYCVSCNASHPESDFPRSKYGKLYSRCKKSYADMATRGKQAAKERHEAHKVNGGADTRPQHGEPGLSSPAVLTPDTRRGNDRDVSAERCCDVASVPETSGSYSRSDPREDVRTPAGDSIAFPHMQSNTPSEHPPVVNPQTANPSGTAVESMEQAGSAPTSARAIESLPTSPPSPAAGSVAAGPPADPALSALAQKRAALIDKREQLLRDYEANLKAVIDKIEEIDRVTEQVQRLCSEAA